MALFYFDTQAELLPEVVKRKSYLDNEFNAATIAPTGRRDK